MLKTRKFPSPNSDLSFESQTGMSNSLRDMPSWVLQKHLKLTVFQTELLGPPCPYQEMVSSVTQIKTSEVLLDSFLPSSFLKKSLQSPLYLLMFLLLVTTRQQG